MEYTWRGELHTHHYWFAQRLAGSVLGWSLDWYIPTMGKHLGFIMGYLMEKIMKWGDHGDTIQETFATSMNVHTFPCFPVKSHAKTSFSPPKDTTKSLESTPKSWKPWAWGAFQHLLVDEFPSLKPICWVLIGMIPVFIFTILTSNFRVLQYCNKFLYI